MTEYKKNHTLPKMMLKYWVDPGAPHESTHVYDIRKKKKFLSTGRGKTAFSFAIQNDLHIPRIEGNRATALEQWFSNLEGSLADFIRQAHNMKVPFSFRTNTGFTKAIMGLVALEYRSRYNLDLIQKQLWNDSRLLSDLTSGDGTEPKRATLENLIHLVTERATAIRPTKFEFLHAPADISWITCDRPCLDLTWESAPAKLVVLTNKTIAIYQQSSCAEDIIRHTTLEDHKAVEATNRDIALNARDWIVADSACLLDQASCITETTEWQESVDKDHLVEIPVDHLATGWRIGLPAED
ncbi:MAG: hypothetical protein AAGF11_10250 [Myxococcota bacterium]